MKFAYLLPFLFLFNSAAHASFDGSDSVDGADFLDTEDQSMIVDSLPLDTETYLTAKPEDVFKAKVVAIVNKSELHGNGQTIRVYENGKIIYKWLVSTGREKLETSVSGKVYRTVTPVGYFRPFKIEEVHHSLTWNSDMPHSVFFRGGVATHEGHAIEKLGMRASGGCVRLSAETAKIFYDLVKKTGTAKVSQINRDGSEALDVEGKPVLADTYNVLIIVENPAPTMP